MTIRMPSIIRKDLKTYSDQYDDFRITEVMVMATITAMVMVMTMAIVITMTMVMDSIRL